MLIVSHHQRRVTLHTRETPSWTVQEFRAQERLSLPALGVELDVDGLYGTLVR